MSKIYMMNLLKSVSKITFIIMFYPVSKQLCIKAFMNGLLFLCTCMVITQTCCLSFLSIFIFYPFTASVNRKDHKSNYFQKSTHKKKKKRKFLISVRGKKKSHNIKRKLRFFKSKKTVHIGFNLT